MVDNNSLDATAVIAKRYPFVTVLPERRQGVVYARDRGFNAARGDIIGRIDADSILEPNWVATVQRLFMQDTSLDAVSGAVHYRDVAWSRAFDTIDLWFKQYLDRRMGAVGEQFLYGVNMAIRRSVWRAVEEHVCHKRHLHEDQDLAVHLSKLGYKNVAFTTQLKVSISPRQAGAGPRQFMRYVWSNSQVYTQHHMISRRYINRIALFVSCLYIPIHLLYRGYNPATGRFSFVYLLTKTMPVRVSPVSEIA